MDHAVLKNFVRETYALSNLVVPDCGKSFFLPGSSPIEIVQSQVFPSSTAIGKYNGHEQTISYHFVLDSSKCVTKAEIVIRTSRTHLDLQSSFQLQIGGLVRDNHTVLSQQLLSRLLFGIPYTYHKDQGFFKVTALPKI